MLRPISSLLLIVSATAGVISGSAAASTPPAAVAIQPLSILANTNCAGNSCQVIDHAGDDVTDWYVETTAPSSICTYARYYKGATLIAESARTCLSSGQEATANWSAPGSFASGTNLCSSWYGIPGRPCTKL